MSSGLLRRRRDIALPRSYFFWPASFSTLLRGPAGTSTPGLPAIVTVPGFVKMLKLPAAAFRPNENPAVGLDQPYQFADLH